MNENNRVESGIDLGFDLTSLEEEQLLQLLGSGDFVFLEGDNNDTSFYQLKSKPVADSPPTSVKTATMTTRTNLKQILQMQQVRDEERKEQEKAKMKTLGTTGVQGSLTNTSAVTVPMTTSLAPRVDVPREVLKVESRLENPTRYHVMENKKRQLQEYLSTAQGTGRSLLAQSVPSDAIGPATTPASTAAVISAAQQHLSSSAPSPDSPNSVALSSSAASEADVIDSIIQMESSMDTDNSNFLQTSTVPDHTNYLEVLKFAPSPAGAKSCPPAVAIKQEFVALTADPQLQALAKDRQKKDNHNMIERRRRYKINDHIKELATLLPKSSDPFFDVIRADRQNKGNILKASVDFIRELKKEVEHLRIESNDIKKLQQENWKLRLQNQQLLNVHNQSASSGAGSPDVSYLLQTTSEAALRVKQEPFEPVVEHHHQQHHHHLSDAALDDFMEDDQHPVNGDPMLPSPMVNDNILLNDEMDFIS